MVTIIIKVVYTECLISKFKLLLGCRHLSDFVSCTPFGNNEHLFNKVFIKTVDFYLKIISTDIPGRTRIGNRAESATKVFYSLEVVLK